MHATLTDIISTEKHATFNIVTTKEMVAIQILAGGDLIDVLTAIYDLNIWARPVFVDFNDNLIEIRKDENGLSFPVVNLLSSERTKNKINLINKLKR